MVELGSCLDATADLLPDTLRKLMNIVTTELEGSSLPPCLFYISLDFLLQVVLRGLPGAEAERKYCETILQWLEPQLIGLSNNIFTTLRVLGVLFIAASSLGEDMPVPVPEQRAVARLVLAPHQEQMLQQTLNISDCDLGTKSIRDGEPFSRVYGSLHRWLLAHHQPNEWRRQPTYIAMHRYTWAWAWDTHASQYPSPRRGIPESDLPKINFAPHIVDLTYCCLRLILLEFNQPLNLIPSPIRQTLEHTPRLLTHAYMAKTKDYWSQDSSLLLELIEAIDFTAMLQGLPDITTIFCPRLFYLHHGLDHLSRHLQADGYPSPDTSIPHYQEFLETIYSRLLQDPLTSRAVPLICAMFGKPSPQTIADLLGLTVGELNRSAAMQGLFGVGFREGRDELFEVSYSLRALLKMGRVKLKPSQDSESGHIDDYMGDAHEYLAFSCMKYFPWYDSPEGNPIRGTPGWYARRYWERHLGRAKSSERLFEALRRMDTISIRDIIFRWLEDIPEDILASWISRWDIVLGPPQSPDACLLDKKWPDQLGMFVDVD